MTRRCEVLGLACWGFKTIEINLGNAMQAMVLTKVKNEISKKFIGDYLLMIVGAG
jgi:hypothetical protein